MRVLIACEYSGTVRDAFTLRGHFAMSCDLLPTESEGPHFQGDIFDIINDEWDLMIAHPPCTYLSYAGIRVWNEPGRCIKRLGALEFFRKLWEAPIEKICIENPRGCATPTIAKFSQRIQPYFFGDEQKKTTLLWLKKLPLLQHFEENTLFDEKTHTNEPEPSGYYPSGKPYYFNEATIGGKDRAKNRAKFWPGIANAMAQQWG